MVFIFIILLGVVVYFYTINVRTLLDKQTEKPLYQYRKANTDPIEKSVTKKDFYGDAEFVNKNCTRLEDFIINDEINGYDLRKLAHLNGIDLHIKPGWYPLTTALINELDKDGWDKTVSCIKENMPNSGFMPIINTIKFFGNTQKNQWRFAKPVVNGESSDMTLILYMWHAESIIWKAEDGFFWKIRVLIIMVLLIYGMI